jgi:RNA polymerase sigma factor (sigma-70 family)
MAKVLQTVPAAAQWWPGGRDRATVRQEPDRLEALLADEYGRLVRLAGVICRDPADAQDAVQAAVERALRSRDALRDPTKVRSWLNQIVVNESIRIDERRRRWWSHLTSGPREIEVASDTEDPGSGSVAAAAALRAAFDALPVEQRVMVALHHYAGYSVVEAATIAGIPLETARSRLRLARSRLRRVLDGVAP